MARKTNTDGIIVIKKDGRHEPFDGGKIIIAVHKSADRVGHSLTPSDDKSIVALVMERIHEEGLTEVPIASMHRCVELALDKVNAEVARSYREYRNFTVERDKLWRSCEDYALNLLQGGSEKENANKDSSLVAVKQALMRSAFEKTLFQWQFLTATEKEAVHDGYIYVHDMSERMDTMNCCVFDVDTVLRGGFRMGNMFYTEPKTLDVAFDVIGDIVLSTASQQYGGFTVPEIDKVLAPYAEKSYHKAFSKYKAAICGDDEEQLTPKQQARCHQMALDDVAKEMEQGFQGWEYKFNTVGSSRGDYPFITMTFGLGRSQFEKLASITCLRVRAGGQKSTEASKHPVLFPKLVFLYDENLHGPGCELEDVFEEGLLCSSKTMYPDWLSLTGEGYVPSMYKQYGKVISPMGCRAFLSPWYERGGMYPADEYDMPVFVGRFNIGVVSLNLPMILAKARQENRDFYEVLDYYLEMIRGIHLRTYEYLGNLRASCNPMAFCEGGFYGGNLLPEDKIRPCLESATASFGITALNELQRLYNGKSLVEDGAFALETMQHIGAVVDEFKRADGRLYAIYGTPGENLCQKQVKQFRAKYGTVKNVSDREWVTNSFHCHVEEKLSPTEKQDLEYRFWDTMNGGKIQYVRYPLTYNYSAFKALIRRAMAMGYYEGVNLNLSYCNDCGYSAVSFPSHTCPSCGSENVTEIDRMNGYLAYSRVTEKRSDGSLFSYSRLSDEKMKEIEARVSM